MSNIEKKIFTFLQKHCVILGFITVTVLSFILRIILYPHTTADFDYFMNSWIDQLKEYPGISGIGQNIGEYNVPYMLFLAIVGRTSFNDLYEIKTFSVIFDYIGSFAVLLLISKIRNTKFFTPLNLIVYSVIVFLPVTFLDSAFWAQCDFIYVSFLLFCTYFMVKEKYSLAMIFFGISFAFKLQAIFFLPVLLIYYLSSKKICILHFLWIPLIFFVADLPAIIAGRSIADTLSIYISQTGIYEMLTMSCPNLFVFLPGDYELFSKMGIIIAFSIFVIAAFAIARFGIKDKKEIVLIALWSSLICIFFLPQMHERYTFICCIFSVVWAFLYHKDWWIAAAINFVTLLSSTPYLFQSDIFELKYLALANLIIIIFVSIRLFVKYPTEKNKIKISGSND